MVGSSGTRALGAIAAVGFLGDLEHQFRHAFLFVLPDWGTGKNGDRHEIRKDGEIRACPQFAQTRSSTKLSAI